ncbi:hypothetical protein AGR6A_Lc90384 [Agrobacterium sp. NCPPB 925]|nr:hypothetical protein AGR6A_Lc90384 [Agrobacterium sp. NCPPB 925]
MQRPFFWDFFGTSANRVSASQLGVLAEILCFENSVFLFCYGAHSNCKNAFRSETYQGARSYRLPA